MAGSFEHDVFISYRRSDQAVAARLEKALKDRGLKVWRDEALDRESTGAAYDTAINQALDASAKVIVLWSVAALQSDWVRGEATKAKSQGKLLPILLEPPESLNLPAPFNILHCLKLAAIEQDFDLLLRALGAMPDAGRAGQVTLFVPDIDISKLPDTYARKLYGRDREMADLIAAWDGGRTKIFALDAMGGAGKTALAYHFVQALKESGWRGARRVFAWSFYSQGSNEDRQTSADEFFRAAFAFFGAPERLITTEAGQERKETDHERGVRLARAVQAQRMLLILDGLEPLQYAAGRAGGGRSDAGQVGGVKDAGVKALLAMLKEANPGLAIVTTRIKLRELEGNPSVAFEALEKLDTAPAIDLLRDLGVEPKWKDHALPSDLRVGGDDRPPMPEQVARELREAVAELGGHALALTLAGKWLVEFHGGDIRAMDELPALPNVELSDPTRSPYRAMQAIEFALARRIDEQGKGRAPLETSAGQQLALLFFLGFFDRPAEAKLLPVVFGGKLEPDPEDETTPLPPALPDGVKERDLPPAEREAREAARDRKKRAVVRRLFLAAGGLSPAQLRAAFAQLAAQGLAAKLEEGLAWEKAGLDCHPLVREYFAVRLKELDLKAFQAAHGRLYDHYRYDGLPATFRDPVAYGVLALGAAFPDAPFKQDILKLADGKLAHKIIERWPPSLQTADPAGLRAAAALIDGPDWRAALAAFQPKAEAATPGRDAGMAPLFAAIAHGCAAGRVEEAWAELYRPRITRGDAGYASKRLGLYGQELAALASFCTTPFTEPSPDLAPERQAVALGNTAFRLRALGRLPDAVAPMRAAVTLAEAQNDPTNAAVAAGNLCELRVTLGALAGPEGALEAGEAALRFAEASGDLFERMGKRTTLAAARAAAGEDAEALFLEAEARQKQNQPDLPRLYSVQGYRLAELLLAHGRAREAAARAEWQQSSVGGLGVLDDALAKLTLARATGQGPNPDLAAFEAAIADLRRANQEAFIVPGLLARAEAGLMVDDRAGATAALAEAETIAARGPMPLFAADAAILRARLCLSDSDPAAARTHYANAATLIDKHGYGEARARLAILAAELDPPRAAEAEAAILALKHFALIPRLAALGHDCTKLRAAEAAWNTARDAHLRATLARDVKGYNPANNPIADYLGVEVEAPEEVNIPDQTVRGVFANPQAQDMLRDVMAQNNLAGAPQDLPFEVQRAIVEALVKAGVIKFGQASEDPAPQAPPPAAPPPTDPPRKTAPAKKPKRKGFFSRLFSRSKH